MKEAFQSAPAPLALRRTRPGGAAHAAPNTLERPELPYGTRGKDGEDGRKAVREDGSEDDRGGAGEGDNGGDSGGGKNRRDGQETRHVSDTSPVRLRRERAPDMRPKYARYALNYRGRRPDTPAPTGSVFGQIPVA
ncbi:hypothetical protein [Streptomyces caelestis]|jgi:hypothetical protein|uniref:hypothetical protein n=1 Tax=Streptomyces caelestis TaxID=36816 RepID=UPI0036F6FDC3